MVVEFGLANIEFAKEVSMPVSYKGVYLGTRRVDFLVADLICVEIKARIQLENIHLNQAKNYVEAFNLEVGLLINFGAVNLEWKRIYNNKYKH